MKASLQKLRAGDLVVFYKKANRFDPKVKLLLSCIQYVYSQFAFLCGTETENINLIKTICFLTSLE